MQCLFVFRDSMLTGYTTQIGNTRAMCHNHLSSETQGGRNIVHLLARTRRSLHLRIFQMHYQLLLNLIGEVAKSIKHLHMNAS